ncbi:efflux RND transporter periplasmic adaptor subunit [Burkholderia gladioli]|uniref:efflux RND transporter periplasmic adaptor subunit n=1 Tax=Burkholderia gladioli TaxID=28095 RepID=UPI001FC7DE6D|nr:efflux RND transporter periplasmic adaptor subunit [Burkholderia gladioli]
MAEANKARAVEQPGMTGYRAGSGDMFHKRRPKRPVIRTNAFAEVPMQVKRRTIAMMLARAECAVSCVSVRTGLGWPIVLACLIALPPQWAHAQSLATLVVAQTTQFDEFVSEAVIESTRQTTVAAQVAGRVTGIQVKAGDRVDAGQILVTLDQRAADQQLAAVRAQVGAALAEAHVAQREMERTKYLFDRQYVSQAALDRASARYKAAAAIANARQSDARAAAVEPTWRKIDAPYPAVIASVDVEIGSMAMPGMPLLTLFDPAALRAVATVPQSRLPALREHAPVRIELPDLPGSTQWQTATTVTVLPLTDPRSDAAQVRLGLPASVGDIRPGMFARAYFPIGDARRRLLVPLSAVVHRTEVAAVYVVESDGRVALRQVRVGKAFAGQAEILAGLSPGERIALDPLAAAARR